MKAWLVLLGGLLIWTVHFFGIYIIGSVFPGTATAQWLAAILTVVCLAALGLILALFVFRRRAVAEDRTDRWVRALSLCGCGLALPAIVFQALPAILH